MPARLHAQSDEELFELFGSKDGEDAFRVMYDRHASRLFAYCARITGSREDAQDILQETFVRFHRHARLPHGSMRVLPFLFTIARNLCINAVKGRKRTVPVEDVELPVFDSTVERAERAQLVQLAVQTLPFAYREALILREYNDFSYAEIADILDLPLDTVRVRIYRARERLRGILAPYIMEHESSARTSES